MNKKRFFPVIHCQSFSQVKKNIDLIKSITRASGIFLINHGKIAGDQFLRLIESVVFNYQSDEFLIGGNDLDNIISNIEMRALGINMLWQDNAGVDAEPTLHHHHFLNKKVNFIKDFEFFGGIHFKYQPAPKISLNRSIELFNQYFTNNGIVTLSGPKTGQAADLSLIQLAKQTCSKLSSNLRIAIASGINSKNLETFWSDVDDFLVCSSLLRNESEIFDTEKLREFNAVWQFLENKINLPDLS